MYKKIRLIPLMLLLVFFASKTNASIHNILFANQDTIYVCPPCSMECDTVEYKTAGKCSHCGMDLIEKKQITVGFYLQQGVEVLDFAGPMEVFTDAGYKVITISSSKSQVISQGVLKISTDFDISNAPQTDVLAFFGGGTARSSANDPQLISWVKSRSANTKYIFSVCTGAFIIGNAGLLDGLTSTTFHSSIDALRASFPKTKVLSNVRFVDNGRVITTAGISAGIDGALHLVSKLSGKELAKNTALEMEYDKWKPEEGLILTK